MEEYCETGGVHLTFIVTRGYGVDVPCIKKTPALVGGVQLIIHLVYPKDDQRSEPSMNLGACLTKMAGFGFIR
jgi:hypothetical protein